MPVVKRGGFRKSKKAVATNPSQPITATIKAPDLASLMQLSTEDMQKFKLKEIKFSTNSYVSWLGVLHSDG